MVHLLSLNFLLLDFAKDCVLFIPVGNVTILSEHCDLALHDQVKLVTLVAVTENNITLLKLLILDDRQGDPLQVNIFTVLILLRQILENDIVCLVSFFKLFEGLLAYFGLADDPWLSNCIVLIDTLPETL